MKTTRNWFVYILRCSDNSLYTGVTTDLQRRLDEHNHGRRAARYTRIRRPVQLVYAEMADSRSEACKREFVLKQLTAAEKRALLLKSPVDITG